jgi:hypothetical protein
MRSNLDNMSSIRKRLRAARKSRHSRHAPPSINAEQYQYEPLNEAKREIRLMTLFAGARGDGISIELNTTSLDAVGGSSNPKYEALSYAWGSEDRPATISVHDFSAAKNGSLTVTQNLAEALQHLRYEDRGRILWIDAICVNQQNLAERSSQVQWMVDIYSLAKLVVAWLGPVDEDSSLAMELLSSLGSRFKVDWTSYTILSLTEEDKHLADRSRPLLYDLQECSAIVSLLRRSWFWRIWIRQEIQKANAAVLLCGSSTISWDCFRTAGLCLAIMPMAEGLRGSEDCLNLIRELIDYEGHPGLDELVYWARSAQCSDPRGKLVSFVICVDVRSVLRIAVSQILSPLHIQVSVVARLISLISTSICLCLLSSHTADANLMRTSDRIYAMLGLLSDRKKAAWNVIPDYARQTEQIYEEVSVIHMRGFQSLSFLCYCDLGHRNSEHDLPTWVPDWACMEDLPEIIPLGYADADVRGEFRRSENNGCGLLHAEGVQLGKIEEAHELVHEHQGMGYSREAKLLQQIIDLAFRILSRTYLDNATCLNAICRTIFVNNFRDNWDLPSAFRATLQESQTLLAKVHATQDSEDELFTDYGMKSFLDKLYLYWIGRSFIATGDGNIGLAPRATKAGDRVCILPGCGTPLVVRLSGSDSTQYQVVGPCYIDCMMTGEALLGPMPDHFRMVAKIDGELNQEPTFYDERFSKIQSEDPRWQLVLGEDYKERFAITDVRSLEQKRQLAHEVMKARKVETVWLDFV